LRARISPGPEQARHVDVDCLGFIRIRASKRGICHAPGYFFRHRSGVFAAACNFYRHPVFIAVAPTLAGLRNG
jgi:hypothetical protein